MCYFAWEATRRWWRWGFLVVIPPLTHAILLSYSRGAMASLGIAAIFVWFRARNKVFISAVYGCMVVLVLVMAGPEIRERFLSIGKADVDESFQSRQNTWGIAVRMANERPLFGFGIRNSNLFTHAYGADMVGRSIHSQYLQTAADSGWVALALYLGLLGSVFLGLRDARRVFRKYTDPETARVKSMASGLECAIVLFCVGAFALSLEHFEMSYILILLAVQLHAITRAVEAKLAPPRPNWPGIGLPHPYPYPPNSGSAVVGTAATAAATAS
jgi:O-antigen ligase